MEMEKVTAILEKKLPVENLSSQKGDFTKQKIVISFDNESDYPQKILIEQFGDKMDLIKDLVEWKQYVFYLNYHVNYWNQTAFGSVSTWKVEPVEAAKPAESELPF